MARKAARTWYTLPDRSATTNADLYVREWRAFAKPLEKALGMKLYGFDPAISLQSDGFRVTFQFPAWLVHKLNAALSGVAVVKDKKGRR